jgi:hypothetical protein
MSLVRSGADPEGAVVVLVGLAGHSRDDLELARARCLAAVDQNAGDAAAAAAVELLGAALERWSGP